MDVSFHISELLFEHDCVIIPGFGGFVGHYSPAKIHPISHTFFPPSKNILFNSKLTRDDGLLLDYISQRENVSYQEAQQAVGHFVFEIKSKLEQKHKVILNNIGLLKVDIENKILFEPDQATNYLEESFGLQGFVSPPVNRTRSIRRKEPLFIDRKPQSEESKQRRKILIPLLVIIPVLLITGWVLFSEQGLNITGSQKTGIVTLPESTSKDITANPADLDRKDETPALKNLDFTEDAVSKSLENGEMPILPKPDPVQVTNAASYHIIGGAFADPMNAEKLVAILRQKGYHANRAGLSKSGLHMVEYLATIDKSEALVNLEMIRKDDNPSAWLLKK